MFTVLKCRKCRHTLISRDETCLLDEHSNILKEFNNSIIYDCGGKVMEVWYLQEVALPDWILNKIDEVEWQKGKLTCPRCQARIGSFDFISGSKCTCSGHVLPSIRLVKSKIDLSAK